MFRIQRIRNMAGVGLAIAMLLCMCSVVTAAQSTQKMTDIGDGFSPAICGTKVIWADPTGSIYIYDVKTNKDKKVTSLKASYPDIYGDKAVWLDESSGTPKLTVYDIPSGITTPILKNVDEYSHPAIYYDKSRFIITWSTGGMDGKVYIRDIGMTKNSKSIQYCIGNGYQPDVYGNKVVFVKDMDEGRRICVYDINTNKMKIVKYQGDVNSPRIYDNKVVFADTYTRLGFLVLYDISSGKWKQITRQNWGVGEEEYGCDTGFHASIYKDTIVYFKAGNDPYLNKRSGEYKAGIYKYDIKSGKGAMIYRNDALMTPEMYGDYVVWGFDPYNDIGLKDVYALKM